MKMKNERIRHLLFVPFILLTALPYHGFCGLKFASSIELQDSLKNVGTEMDSQTKWHVDFHPSLGLTFGTTNYESEKSTNLQWLGTLNSNVDYLGKKFDFSSSLFAQYGQSKKSGEPAEKIKDAFVLSVTPSIPIIRKPAIRLFLETSAETNLGKGTQGNYQTGFCNPLFLYETLFLGQKHYSYKKNEKFNYELTYGLGYSLQQTINNDSQVQNSQTGNKQGFETGFSGILEFNMDYAITNNINFNFSSKSMVLFRESLWKNFDAARKTILITTGIFFKHVGLEYNYHFVDDNNLSLFPMIDQSLMLTLRF